MQVQRQTATLHIGHSHFHNGHTTIVGFSAHDALRGSGQQACGSRLESAKSLLSELLKDAADVAAPSEIMSCMSDEYESDDMEDEFLGSMELAAMEFEMADWSPVTKAPKPHAPENSDKSSTCSQPIPIPACTYFKDEVQRAALQKLNQKRQWYQQQLESERMRSKGSVPKLVPTQAPTSARMYHRNSARQPT